MARPLDTTTLDDAARYYAGQFLGPDRRHPRIEGKFISGPSFVAQEFYNFAYKDEFTYMVARIREQLGPAALKDFDDLAARKFAPRDDKMFAQLLADNLAIDIDGNHISGKIGRVQLGSRVVGKRLKPVVLGRRRLTLVKDVFWPVYAGEAEERAANSGVADELPPGAEPLPVGALNTRISNECAILACNAIVDNLDEGTGAAVIQGRSGAQPADPDTVVTGTLLFTLVCTDPAFGNAVDDTGKATATASAITDDTSADATATLGYCRASATNDGATPLDDHIDGEAGTSGADFNFNTVSIVTGATVSMTSWTVSMPES